MSFWTSEAYIDGVPNNKNSGTTPACGPVSGLNIIEYWDNNGYSNLITFESKQTVYELLYYYMGSFKVPRTDEHATSPYGPYNNGLEEYFSHKGYTASVTRNFNIQDSNFNSFIVTEVNNDRPGTILYYDNDHYGLHYTTLVGYAYDEMNTRYYSIHDLWSSSRIYRNWNSDLNNNKIWATFKVVPQ
ncbi:conserved hypothetical protein [Alkaliphilus metalliredigens QYMF]|uniref:Peptidase C39-like domain-containing protein n=1 Tax=Alkaliphilus metalliredigens (strain QYMF) TaxID=293826 RepID=A6TM91_ALKMQ|nr:hypothetical protein [Alkaliphilus metalliredigens]ABR47309.1 conserved hypothetical protein [Alkaliphilus metalliredigens QYMF]